MLEMRVTGLRLSDSDSDRGGGIVARFDCDLGIVLARGCLLRLGEDGVMMAYLPRCHSRGASLRLADHATRLRLTDAAVVAYRALGGSTPTP